MPKSTAALCAEIDDLAGALARIDKALAVDPYLDPGAEVERCWYDTKLDGAHLPHLILPTPSIAYARDRAAQYVAAARSAAADLPAGEARAVLEAMAEFAVQRPM